MADLVITPGSVVPAATATLREGTAGETITAGQPVAMVNGVLMKADVDHATASYRRVLGISVNGASLGQPVSYIKDGDLAMGAILTAGSVYVASDTPGGISAVADPDAGDAIVILGVAKSTTVLAVNIFNSGATK